MPPSITAQPQSQTLQTGNCAIFSVTATGTAPLYYQWLSNGVPQGPFNSSSNSHSECVAASYSVLVSVGSTALVARFIGAGDRTRAVAVTHQSLLLAVVLGVTATPIAFLGGLRWVVVDEVQRVPDILNEVHRLIESRGLRFVLTGSSARKLRRRGVNLLAGRARLPRWPAFAVTTESRTT